LKGIGKNNVYTTYNGGMKLKAATYQIEATEVADAKLMKTDDILVRVTSTAICGSDLHLYQGNMPLLKDM
jgi:S-(hydroxymethyl)glutathione dehydrogenase/alcohol dehydrogenase